MDRYFAVDCICMFFGSMRFGGTNAVFITQQLPVQIAFFKTIPVDDRNMPDSDPQEVFQKIAAESAASYDAHALFGQFFLFILG